MKFPYPVLTALIVLLSLACSDSDDRSTASAAAARPVPEALQSNQLAGSPSTFLNSAAKSPIHWQTWSPEVLEVARESERLVFALFGSARYPGCFETLNALDKQGSLVRRLNEQFVPVLVDIDLNRETSLLAYSLAQDTGQTLAFPFLMLLSPEGAPVTWHSLPYSSDDALLEFFNNSVEIITRLWDESPAYIVDDSATKLELRQGRIPPPPPAIEDQDERRKLHHDAIRRLTSFYDEDIQSMAGVGGVLPLGVFELLTLARVDPSLPADLRSNVSHVLHDYAGTILRSAMIDPLDGGLYPSRALVTWNMPSFRRDATTQARGIRVLSWMAGLGAHDEALNAALGAVRFTEANFRTPDGLFSLTLQPSLSPEREWLWTIDQARDALGEDEFKVWRAASDLKSLGNLAPEADPSRRYFRLNSLRLGMSAEEIAATTGFTIDETRELLESGRKKLLKARESRFPSPRPDPTPSATVSFQMISAYAALYTATGDSEWRQKAVELGQTTRATFGASRFINERPDGEPEGMSDSRALTYATAIQAGLDLGAVTLDDSWYIWAQDLSTLLAEHFVTSEGRLAEVREVSKVVQLDFEDGPIVFGESTAGLVRLNLARLESLGFETHPKFAPWTTSVPPVTEVPIIFTTDLRALSYRWAHRRLAIDPEAGSELQDEVARLPLELFERRREEADGPVVITAPDGEKTIVETGAELPDPGKSMP